MALPIRLLSLLCFLAIAVAQIQAQVPTGTPPFGSFGGGPDIINLANLNSHISIPVLNKAGRGTNFTYDLSYDSFVWYPVGVSGNQTWTPASNWGWRGSTEVATGYISYTVLSYVCLDNHGTKYFGGRTTYSNWVYHDSFGISHAFSGTTQEIAYPCINAGDTSLNTTTADGSGFTLNAVGPGGSVFSKQGQNLNAPINSGSGSATSTDRNGNEINVDGSGHFYDTLSATVPVLTVSGTGTPTSPVVFTYTPPNTSSANCVSTNTTGVACYSINYTNYTVATNFGVFGISEYKSKAAVPLVTSIVLPDGSQYTFGYEATPGTCAPYSGTTCTTSRMTSVTLPTGGKITYAYSGGNNGIFSDGSTATLTRTTTPGGQWSYVQAKGTGVSSTTTITDPLGNETVLQFQGIYLTKQQIYSGTANLLKSIEVCYDGATPDCTGTAVALPITQRAVYDEYPDSSSTALQTKTITTYNSYGLVTGTDQYAFGTGSPGGVIRKTLVTYATLGGNVVSAPSLITVENSSGTIVGQTSYSYDQYSLGTTSSPQHVSVSSARANATTIYSAYKSGSSVIRGYTYYDTGKVATTTDPNGSVTNYSYAGTGSCGNAFVTNISLPLNLSESFTWNCTGGVMASATDVAGNQTTYQYSDPYFWRLGSIVTPDQVTTNVSYPSQNAIESYLNFNGGASTVDVLTTFDGLGRSQITQRRQGPGATNYDSYESYFDPIGRVNKLSIGYSGTSGSQYSGSSFLNLTYDPLDRPLQGTDAGSGAISHSYVKNDVIETIGPPAPSENAKVRQFEMDALGHITSVCEITSATGSGSCGQTNGGNGFLTQYQFDLFGNLTSVTQNAQSSTNHQQRSFTRDFLGRITQEVTPEAGTLSYVYDSQSDPNCATSPYGSGGDRVERIDAKGNTTCYYYDQLHRLSRVTYSGPDAGATPEKHFVYDTATVNSVSMLNAGGRVADAYTCLAPCTSKITDLGFSYSKTGQLTDVFESTPHSNGYYHVTASFWESGMLKTLGGLPSPVPTLTYSSDPEGRPAKVTGSDSSQLVTGVNYNVDSNVSTLTYGTGDTDGYSYDSTSGRMTQYQFNVNGTLLTGRLGWNQNGSLQTQNITDGFNPGDTQNCTYLYDDLSRLSNVSCPGVWSQTFAYDTFGNITKSGNGSFQPTYSSSSNQYTSLPGATPTYDANGNLTYDGMHHYQWDAEGRVVNIDNGGVQLTYSAFGNMVEQNIGGVTDEIVYGPSGEKLGILNGQTILKGFLPLPAAAKAVYTSSGLAYYQHSDWLGSYRLATTPARGLYSDVAYAPFGEPYAQSGTGTPAYSFTGKNEDTVQNLTTGLYDFPLRELSPTQGRWTCPDPAGLARADLLNPQTFNRYSYLANSPLVATDPSGLGNCVAAGGIMNGPGSHNLAIQNLMKNAVISYPYQGQGFFKGLWSVIVQGLGFVNSATRILANDINFALSSGPINDLVLFSGSAQSYQTALNNGLISDPSQIQNVIYLSPGCFGGDCLAAGAPVFHGHGFVDRLATLFTRHSTDTALACGHSMNCELQSLPQSLQDRLKSDCQIETQNSPLPDTLEDPTALALSSAAGGGGLISLGPIKQTAVPNIAAPPGSITIAIGGVVVSITIIGIVDPCLFFPDFCDIGPFPPDPFGPFF